MDFENETTVKQKRKLGLKFQLLILLFTLNLIAATAYSAVLYSIHRAEIIAGIDKQLQTAANAVNEIVPADYHKIVSESQEVSPEAYNFLLNRLSHFANRSNLVYVYTYMEFDNRIRVVSTSATPEEIRANTQTPFFSVYDSAPARLYESFADGRTRFDEYSDSFGRFRSIYMPVRDDNGVVYVIGADVDLGELHSRIVDALLKSIAIGVAMFALSMVVGWLLVARIVEPLSRLTAFTRSMARRDFQPDVAELSMVRQIGTSRSDEVGSLAEAMAAMIARLERYLIDVATATAARERVEGELSAAHDIQVGMLPRTFPPFPDRSDIDVFALLEPAKQVGGDLYDFFLIDDDRLFFVIGDVSGKGVPAALFMAMTKTLFKAQALSGASTADIMARVNAGLARDNAGQMFVTAFAGVLDLRDGSIEYSDGGHEPPFIIRACGSVERLEKEGGLALGALEDVSFTAASIQLWPGDKLVLFTDGVTEAENADEEMYTEARIKKALEKTNTTSSARQIAEGLAKSARSFVGAVPQSDDIAILTICYKGKVSPTSVEVTKAESVN
ncbi:MAG: SpoIIE family protein phosphatase [Pseudomonadota bacterium]